MSMMKAWRDVGAGGRQGRQKQDGHVQGQCAGYNGSIGTIVKEDEVT